MDNLERKVIQPMQTPPCSTQTMNTLIKVSGKVWKAFSTIGIVCMFICVLVIILNIIFRRFFRAPIFGSTEIVRYMALCAASFSIIENEWINGNVSMPIIIDALPRKLRNIVLFIGFAITSCIFVVIDYLLIRQSFNKFVTKSVTQELEFPMWIPSAVLAVGFCALTLVIILKTVIYGWMVKTGVEVQIRESGS